MNAQHDDQPPDHAGAHGTINGAPFHLVDATPTGEQVLTAGGFEPADDYVLIQVMEVGTRLISLDEVITGAGNALRFFAFPGGEVYQFTINTHGYQWGRATIAEPELRDLARVKSDAELVWERPDQAPKVLVAGDQVHLAETGTEHFRTQSRLIEVFLDNEPKEVARGTYTTEQLIDLLGVKPGYVLNLQRPDGLTPLKPGERTNLTPGMRFFSHIAAGGSS